MITLEEALKLLEQHGVKTGYLVGGIVEKGHSTNDIDIITEAELPPPFHAVKDSKVPNGPYLRIDDSQKISSILAEFRFMKPKKTERTSNEYYDLNDFRELKGSYYAEPKYDGIRVLLIKNAYVITVRTDEGNFIQEKLPNITEEARKIPYESAILDCELVIYHQGKRQSHTEVTSYLRSKTPAEDYHLRLKPFDILYADGEDLRSKPLSERKKLLEKLQDSDHIHQVKYLKAEANLVQAIENTATSEGAMIKNIESTYNVGGEGWYKWKRQLQIDAKVTKVEKVHGGYIYTCEAGGIEIGKTYATQIEAEVGDIILVSVDHITRREKGFTWYAPKVREVRKDKKEPDPASTLEKMAALKEKEKEKDTAPVLSGDFVLQEHWWGEKHHFDLRFRKLNLEGKPTMIGFTLFADSLEELRTKLENGEKILSKQKEYHTPEWLNFEGEIQPGNPGNPTKNLVAYMKIRDKGKYEFTRRETDFVDMTLSGKTLDGRYYCRKVQLKDELKEMPEHEDREGKWLFWKAKEKENVNLAFGDSIEIHQDSLEEDDSGMLIHNAALCKAMVQDYHGIKTLKPLDELRKAMMTVQRMMVTDDHPPGGLIQSLDEIKGMVMPGSERFEDGGIKADLRILDKELIEKIRKGKRDLSPGFICDIREKSGEFQGAQYEAEQSNIIFDHIAVVEKGRCSRDDGCGILDAATLKSHAENFAEIMKEMHTALEKLPEDHRKTLLTMLEKIKAMMLMMRAISDSAHTSRSSITDDEKKSEEKTRMENQKLTVDGVEYTPETIKQIAADAKANVAIADELKKKIDAAEAEKKAPLIKAILDAVPALKEEDLKTWSFERLQDAASKVTEASHLRIADNSQKQQSIIDAAYDKVGA